MIFACARIGRRSSARGSCLRLRGILAGITRRCTAFAWASVEQALLGRSRDLSSLGCADLASGQRAFAYWSATCALVRCNSSGGRCPVFCQRINRFAEEPREACCIRPSPDCERLVVWVLALVSVSAQALDSSFLFHALRTYKRTHHFGMLVIPYCLEQIRLQSFDLHTQFMIYALHVLVLLKQDQQEHDLQRLQGCRVKCRVLFRPRPTPDNLHTLHPA
jgi:hypothetical protein